MERESLLSASQILQFEQQASQNLPILGPLAHSAAAGTERVVPIPQSHVSGQAAAHDNRTCSRHFAAATTTTTTTSSFICRRKVFINQGSGFSSE